MQLPSVGQSIFSPSSSSSSSSSIISSHINTRQIPESLTIVHSEFLEIRGGTQSELEESDDEDDSSPIVSKIFSLLGNTVMGIMDTISGIIDAIFASSASNEASGDTQATFKDFGSYLSHAYGCAEKDGLDDNEEDSSINVEGGSLTKALQKARSNARLLVVYIPVSKPSTKKNKLSSSNYNHDQIAISSIRSPSVKKAADKQPKKKEKYGSFLFWSSKVDSSEASTAMKRLKVKPSKKTKSSPILVVVYPSQTFDTLGNPKIVPKVIAQHHCNPPPSPKSLSSWLTSLRKRHGKQYTAMRTELREIAFMKERTEGYESSKKSDQERIDKERIERERKIDEERLRKEKEAALKERRKSLLESLPEEPESTGNGIITIALRFGDGRTGQRRFTSDTELETVFNWVDAKFEMERELVVLTAMNGQKSFSFEESQEGDTLDDVGLGRLVAFRVSPKQDDSKEGNAETDPKDKEEDEVKDDEC